MKKKKPHHPSASKLSGLRQLCNLIPERLDDFFRCVSFLFHESFCGAPRRFLS